jgi:soluble lytic murein transglycosylase-like protein
MAYVNVLSGVGSSLANFVKNPATPKKISKNADVNTRIDSASNNVADMHTYLQHFAIEQSKFATNISTQLNRIEKRIDYISQRISPKIFTIGKGKDRQSVKYDPLAPEGRQVTLLTSSGKSGRLASKKGGALSEYNQALSKAAYSSNTEQNGATPVNIKPKMTVAGSTKEERSALYKKLSYEMREDDPVYLLKVSMEKNFKKLFNLLEELKNNIPAGGNLPWKPKIPKIPPISPGVVAAAAPAVAAAGGVAVTAGGAKALDKAMKQGANKAIDSILTDVTKNQLKTGVKPEESYAAYKTAMDLAMSKATPEKQKYFRQQWLNSEGLSDLERNMAARYFGNKSYKYNKKTNQWEEASSQASPSISASDVQTPSKPAPSTTQTPSSTIASPSAPSTKTGVDSKVTDQKMPDSTVKDYIISAAKKVGVDVGIMMAMAKQESGFNPNAVPMNKKTGRLMSSAKGLYQFLDSTWNSMVAKYGSKFPELGKGPFHPEAGAIAGALYIKENSKILKQAGIPINGTTIYASHFLGPGGAKTLFSANPDTNAVKLMPAAAKSNPWIFMNKDGSAKTAEEVQNTLFEKVGKFANYYAEKITGKSSSQEYMSPPLAPATPATPASPAPTATGTTVTKPASQVPTKPVATTSGTNLSQQSSTLADNRMAAATQSVVNAVVPMAPPVQCRFQPQKTNLPDASIDNSDDTVKKMFGRDRWA